jgi:hypothetical protein
VRSVRLQCFGIVSSQPEHASPLLPRKPDLRSEPQSLSRPSTTTGSPIRLYEEHGLLQNCLVCDPTVNQLSMFRFSTHICVDSAWQKCRRHQRVYLEQWTSRYATYAVWPRHRVWQQRLLNESSGACCAVLGLLEYRSPELLDRIFLPLLSSAFLVCFFTSIVLSATWCRKFRSFCYFGLLGWTLQKFHKMKSSFLLGLLASTSLASTRVHSGTHAMAVAACLISWPLTALAVPVWSPASRLVLRQANSTTTGVAATYTVVSGDTIDAIAAATGITTQQLEDANPGVVPTDLQVGQVLNVPASSNSSATSSSMTGNSTLNTATTATQSDTASAATQSTTVDTVKRSNIVDRSDGGAGGITGDSTASAGTSQQNSTSTCGSHHHHHNGTAVANIQGHNGTSSTGHHGHNGTTTNHAHNSTSSDVGSGGCTAHHHHNSSAAGTAAAASFFIPATATASALAVALTSSAATGNVVARSLSGFSAMLHRT